MGRPLHSQQQCVRPFIPPGRGSSPVVLLQAQLPDLLQGLDAALSKDWPRSFIKVRMSSRYYYGSSRVARCSSMVHQ